MTDDRPPLLARAKQLAMALDEDGKAGTADLIRDLVAAVGDLQQENAKLNGDVQHLLDTCVPVHELEGAQEAYKEQGEELLHHIRRAAVAEAQLQALRQTFSDLLARISNGQRQSIGSIDNVRAVQFGVDEIERLRATLTQPGAAGQEKA